MTPRRKILRAVQARADAVRNSASRRNPIHDLAEDYLASVYEPEVSGLAGRQQVADALGFFAARSRPSRVFVGHSILGVLNDRFAAESLTRHRLAFLFGVVGDNSTDRISAIEVSEIAARGHDGAAMTAALLGSPIRVWRDASDRERAALLLGQLVRHVAGGAS